MCTVLLPPSVNPIAINEYVNYINIKFHYEPRPLLTVSLHFVIDGMISFILLQYVWHKFFYWHIGKSVHKTAAKLPETNVSGDWFVFE